MEGRVGSGLISVQDESTLLLKKNTPRKWSTFLLSFLASLTTVLGGYSIAYPSSALLDLRQLSDERAFEEGSTMENLFGAMVPIGAVIGGIISGISADKLGRKPTLVLTVIPNLIGWILIGVSWFIHNAVGFDVVILSGRFFTGITSGMSIFVAAVYIGEVSLPSLRGLFSSFPQLFFVFGMTTAYCFGAISALNYYHNAFIVVGLTIAVFLSVLFVPETPRFLIVKGKSEKAFCVLVFLWGPNCDITEEMDALEKDIKQENKLSLTEFFLELKKRSVYLSFMLMVPLMMLQQLSGINAIAFYAAPILNNTGFDANPDVVALAASGVPALVFTFICTLIVDIFGRKFLLVISASALSLSCAALGCSAYLRLNALAAVSVVGINGGFAIGFGAIPWVMIAEMTPLKVRGVIGGILSGVNWSFAALVTGLYLLCAKQVSHYLVWWTFSVFNLISIIYVAVFLPETKGKKLENMERELQHNYRLCAA